MKEKKPRPYCKNCDKRFYDEEKLKIHIEEHVTCRYPGCTFSASRGMMKGHKMLHDPRYG